MALRGAFQVSTLILVSLSSLQLSQCKRETLCPPQQVQNNVTAQTGTHIKLDCQSSGAAIISVKWFIIYENGQSLLIEKSTSTATLTPNPRVRFESGVGRSTTSIFIGPLEKQDEHNYSCFLNIQSCPLSVTTITLTVIEQTTNDHVGIGLALGFFLLLTVLLFLCKTCKHCPSHCWKPCDGKEDQHQPSVVYSEVWVKNATPKVKVNSRVDRTVYAILEKRKS